MEDEVRRLALEQVIKNVGGEQNWNQIMPEAKEELLEHYIGMQKERINIDNEKKRIEKEKLEIDFYKTEMFRIDRSTPSINDIDVTRSEIAIEQTIEYKQKGQEVMRKIMDKEISGAEGRKILDDKIIEYKRLMDARRHKTKSVIRSKIDKNYASIKRKGWDSRCFTMDTVSETERDFIENDHYGVYIPSLEVFINHAMKMKESILSQQKNKIERPEHYCMASICLSGKSHFYTKTNNTPVLNPDGDVNHNFYSILTEEVKNSLGRVDDYEESNTEIVCKHVTMSYTISQWESIKNWYPENTPTVPFKKFEDFTVFLAFNEEFNCEQQCVEYLNNIFYGNCSPATCGTQVDNEYGVPTECPAHQERKSWDPTKKFEDMIPQEKILTYIPYQDDMRYVKKFSDLMSDFHEDIAIPDCKNIARIIRCKEHMAVITEIKQNRRKNKIQCRKPLKISSGNSEDNKEIFMDIEAFNRMTTDGYGEQVPYLVCWTDGCEVNNISGENCMQEFIDRILDKYKDSEEIVIYAWYGSGYDYQHIYPYLKSKCSYDNCKLRSNSIIYAEFIFEHLNLKIYLKDPWLFILSSLDKAAKAFGVINKGKFPHQIIKDWPDLDKVLENWIVIKHELVETNDNNTMSIYIKEWEEFEKYPNHKTILERATDYCTIDVIAMQQVWYKFSKLVKEQLNIQISRNIFTLSQLSMNIMEACLPRNVWLYVPSRIDYDFIHNAIYGGRVVAKNGVYEEPILYADVVSLYPSAMKLLDHGYGKPTRVSKIDWNKHGIYDVTLTHKEEKEPHNYMPFVPRRIDKKLYWGWFKQHRGTYHTYDLMIAKDQDYQIECHSGLEYPSKGYIFNDFIDKLYKLKDDHSKCNCPENPCPIRMIAKIALNGGGYGKFVQKPIDIDTYIVRRDVIAGECAKLRENENGEIYFGGTLTKRPKFQHLDGEHYDKMIFENESEPYYATQTGISILSGSRYRLYNLCKELSHSHTTACPTACPAGCQKQHEHVATGCQEKGMEIIYSDTDSIFVRKSTVDWDKFKQKCGTELGQLDDTIDKTPHGIIHHMLIGGPKMYAYEYYDYNSLLQISLHCKGIPLNMLTIDQFNSLLKHKDNNLAYEFTIINKRLVTVHTRNIIKTIKKT